MGFALVGPFAFVALEKLRTTFCHENASPPSLRVWVWLAHPDVCFLSCFLMLCVSYFEGCSLSGKNHPARLANWQLPQVACRSAPAAPPHTSREFACRVGDVSLVAQFHHGHRGAVRRGGAGTAAGEALVPRGALSTIVRCVCVCWEAGLDVSSL